MSLRWKKEKDGNLMLQFEKSKVWKCNDQAFTTHWEDVPIFEPKETTDIEQAVAAERERCARLVERTTFSVANKIAAMIRESK